MKEYIVNVDEVGLRLDRFVSSKHPEYARSALLKHLDGNISVNGLFLKAGYKLRLNDIINYDPSFLHEPPHEIELEIIFENNDLVVVNKPTGILSHSKGTFSDEGTVASWLVERYKLSDGETANNRLGIVHRLDRDTSGVMICAKNLTTSHFLQKAFSIRKVKKNYVAIVEGTLKIDKAIIDAPIARNPKNPKTFMVSSLGKSAITEYQVLKSNEKYSILKLVPTTGRTHQLRVHLSHLGHPIVGDRIYGKPANRLFLHAELLEITIPGGDRKVFKVELPDIFNEFFDASK